MAENGQVALDFAAQMQFDLIVMDVNMPVLDGLSATRELRRGDTLNRETPVAFLSASARLEDHALGYGAGGDAYVDKPVDFVTLTIVLAHAQGGREGLHSIARRQQAA